MRIRSWCRRAVHLADAVPGHRGPVRIDRADGLRVRSLRLEQTAAALVEPVEEVGRQRVEADALGADAPQLAEREAQLRDRDRQHVALAVVEADRPDRDRRGCRSTRGRRGGRRRGSAAGRLIACARRARARAPRAPRCDRGPRRRVAPSSCSPMASSAGQSSRYASSVAARTRAARALGPSGKRRARSRNVSRACARCSRPSSERPRSNRYSEARGPVGSAARSSAVRVGGVLPPLLQERALAARLELCFGRDVVRRSRCAAESRCASAEPPVPRSGAAGAAAGRPHQREPRASTCTSPMKGQSTGAARSVPGMWGRRRALPSRSPASNARKRNRLH